MHLISSHPKGTSVIEILLALSMSAIIFLSVGKVLAAVQTTNSLTRQKENALALAKESIEVITEIQHETFGCNCTTHDCASLPGSCVRADTTGNQSCALPSIYTSCWTQFPKDLSTLTPLHIEKAAGTWVLLQDEEQIVADTTYKRSITIENLQRDANGTLVEAGGTVDPNTKRITSNVKWSHNGNDKEVTLSILLTSWENH